MIQKGMKFRIYPTKEQKELIIKTIGCARFVYNQELARHQRQSEQYWWITEEMYQSGQLPSNNWKGDFFKKNESVKNMPKYKKNHDFLKEVDSIALQASVENLNDAYSSYYKKQNKHPRFKKKKNEVQTYTTKNGNGTIIVEGNRICLPKLGWVKFAKSKEVQGKISKVTVRRTPSDKFFISILVETEVVKHSKTEKSIGIDLGIKTFAVCSDGTKIKADYQQLKLEERLIREQQKLAFLRENAWGLKKPLWDAKNYQKQRIKVAKIHEKIKNRREDFLQKLTTDIVKNHDIICLEDLQVKDMMQNEDLAKKIGEAAWAEFRRMIEYKCEWHDKTVVFVGKGYPSSQNCSQCGHKNKKVKDLGLRKWACDNCGTIHDRDENASKNILHEGLRILTAGVAGLA